MSMQGCYSLQLACDSCRRRAEYSDELGTHCRAQAKKDGWRWNEDGLIVRCNSCRAELALRAVKP